MNFGRNPEAPREFLTPQAGRLDLYASDFAAGQPTPLAVSVGRDGLVTVFQRHSDGHAYWYSVKCSGLEWRTGLEWNLGRDGRGNYPCTPTAKFTGFRFWNRALALEELRTLKIR